HIAMRCPAKLHAFVWPMPLRLSSTPAWSRLSKLYSSVRRVNIGLVVTASSNSLGKSVATCAPSLSLAEPAPEAPTRTRSAVSLDAPRSQTVLSPLSTLASLRRRRHLAETLATSGVPLVAHGWRATSVLQGF